MASKKKTPPKPVKKTISGKIQKEKTPTQTPVGVSAPETIQKPSKEKEWTLQTQNTKSQTPQPQPTQKEIEEMLAWYVVQDMTEGARNMKKFEKIEMKRIAFAAFISAPECSDLTQVQFCAKFKINEATAWRWRHSDDVEQLRKYFLKYSMQRHTPKVLKQLKKAATTDDDEGKIQLGAVKTFLAYAEDFNEKIDMDIMQKSTLTVNFANVPSSQFLRPVEQKGADKKKLQKINKKK